MGGKPQGAPEAEDTTTPAPGDRGLHRIPSGWIVGVARAPEERLVAALDALCRRGGGEDARWVVVLRERSDAVHYLTSLVEERAELVELDAWWRRFLTLPRRIALVLPPGASLLPVLESGSTMTLSLVAVSEQDVRGALAELARDGLGAVPWYARLAVMRGRNPGAALVAAPQRSAPQLLSALPADALETRNLGAVSSPGVRPSRRVPATLRGRGRIIAIVAAALTGAASAVTVERPHNATPRAPVTAVGVRLSPPARGGGAVAWDRAHDQLVLFGGFGLRGGDAGEILDDTWTWQAGSWRRISGDAPPPRVGGTMAWDPLTSTVLLTGGFGPGGVGPLTDVWSWTGEQWVARAPALRVDTVLLPIMVTTPTRAGVVLLTTTRALGSPTALASTWSWTGSSWVQLTTTSPLLTSTAVAAADDDVSEVLMVESAGASSAIGGQTWSFDGHSWVLRDRSGPAQFDPLSAVMGVDDHRDIPVLFEAPTGGPPITLTWDWFEQRWTVTARQASPGTAAALVTNDAGELLLVGGPVRGDLTEFWRWSGSAWEPVTSG